MGKNQAYKAMQRAKMSSHTAGVVDDLDDGMMDGSFHSPEWHAARLASLQTSHTITWEEFKRKQKDEARRQSELEDTEARKMREYRAQLDAERAAKLSRGRNHVNKRERAHKRGKKDKRKSSGKKKKSEKKRRRSDESDTDGAGSSSSDDEAGHRERRRQQLRKRHKRRSSSKAAGDSSSSSSSDSSSSCSGDEKRGPVRLSSFFENGKAPNTNETATA